MSGDHPTPKPDDENSKNSSNHDPSLSDAITVRSPSSSVIPTTDQLKETVAHNIQDRSPKAYAPVEDTDQLGFDTGSLGKLPTQPVARERESISLTIPPAPNSPSIPKKHAIAETESFSPPAKLGPYILGEPIGKGGFGAVYLATHQTLRTKVAIKILRFDRPASLESNESEGLLEEAKAAAQLDHPGIVKVKHVDEDPQVGLYIVYEFVPPGRTLRDLFKMGTLKIPAVIDLVAGLCDAIDAAHKVGIIHRDLKPTNILIDPDGKPKITDFGLAANESRLGTYKGFASGTLSYMAPEQLEADVHRFDGRVDIWAIGVILYEALTGRLPFGGENRSDTQEQIQHRTPKPPSQIRDGIPPQLEQICLKCLEKDHHKRFANVRELAAELRAVKASLTERPRSNVWNSPVVWVSLAACAFALTALVSVVVMSMRPPNKPSGPTLAEGDNAAPREVQSVLAANSGDPKRPYNPDCDLPPRKVRLTTDPPGARVVFWRVNTKNGLPDPQQRYEPEMRSPVEISLYPGYYLVVAALDDGRFHEVWRTVPEQENWVTDSTRHRNAQFEDETGHVLSFAELIQLAERDVKTVPASAEIAVRLEQVAIPQFDVANGMLEFGNNTRINFRMGMEFADDYSLRVHNRSMDPFLLDGREVMLEEFRSLQPIGEADKSPKGPIRIRQIPPNHAVICDWDSATVYAEMAGKRLMTEAEYEFACMRSGHDPFPWGDTYELDHWPLGPVGSYDRDAIKVTSAKMILGMYSNAPEWTSSLAFPYPGVKAGDIGNPMQGALSRVVVRGGPFSALRGSTEPPVADEKRFGYRGRLVLEVLHPLGEGNGPGFRCARSLTPRLLATQLETAVK